MYEITNKNNQIDIIDDKPRNPEEAWRWAKRHRKYTRDDDGKITEEFRSMIYDVVTSCSSEGSWKEMWYYGDTCSYYVYRVIFKLYEWDQDYLDMIHYCDYEWNNNSEYRAHMCEQELDALYQNNPLDIYALYEALEEVEWCFIEMVDKEVKEVWNPVQGSFGFDAVYDSGINKNYHEYYHCDLPMDQWDRCEIKRSIENRSIPR